MFTYPIDSRATMSHTDVPRVRSYYTSPACVFAPSSLCFTLPSESPLWILWDTITQCLYPLETRHFWLKIPFSEYVIIRTLGRPSWHLIDTYFS